jgi:hypothetical protein
MLHRNGAAHEMQWMQVAAAAPQHQTAAAAIAAGAAAGKGGRLSSVKEGGRLIRLVASTSRAAQLRLKHAATAHSSRSCRACVKSCAQVACTRTLTVLETCDMDHMVAADSAHVHTQDREPVRKIIDWYSILEK